MFVLLHSDVVLEVLQELVIVQEEVFFCFVDFLVLIKHLVHLLLLSWVHLLFLSLGCELFSMFFHEYSELFLDLLGLELMRLGSSLSLALLLESFSVPQTVESMICAAHPRADAREHNYFDFFAG